MPQPATLKPIRPSAAIRDKYDARLRKMVEAMHRDIEAAISSTWRGNEPETVMFGADEMATAALQRIIRALSRKWTKRFDVLSDSLADYFATAVNDRCDKALRMELRKNGFSVKFKMTDTMREAYNAVRAENVGLIKSIPEKHLAQVDTLVMQSVSRGRDLKTLTDELVKQTGITKRRAANIALSQNNMATATMRSVRERELGITEGIWVHSRGGREPRERHVSFNGKRFSLAEGHDFGDGFGKVLPGQAINCLPGDTSIDLVNGCHEIWRYHYRGRMITLEAGESVVRATPNHPFLTDEGWVAAEAINEGDYVWQARVEKFEAGVRDVDKAQVTIEEVFLAFGRAEGISASPAVGFDFHGDIPDTIVESVRPDPRLIREWHASLQQGVTQFPLAITNAGTVEVAPAIGEVLHPLLAGGGGQGLAPIAVGAGHPQDHGLSRRSGGDPCPVEPMRDERSGNSEVLRNGQDGMTLMEHLGDSLVADVLEVGNGVNAPAKHDAANDGRGDVVLSGDLSNAHSVAIHADDLIERDINALRRGAGASIGSNQAPDAESLAQLVRVHAQMGSQFFEAGKFRFDRVRVSNKLVRHDSGCHVYTLQSDTGWYSAGRSSLATKNCRCVWRAVIPAFDNSE